MSRPIAVVTGASGGIGAATARRLSGEGFDVVLGARRMDRLREVAAGIGPGARVLPLDVTDADSVAAFAAEIPECRVLVNNAGGAKGLESVAQMDPGYWRWMYEANVVGVGLMVRALLPALVASGDGHVVTIGSVAGIEPYPGGAGYNAAKHAVRAVMSVLRMELLGQPVRVTEIDPGMVETDFSLVRFDGDAVRAAQVYAGVTPLSPDDIADCVAFAVTRPSHVNIDELVVRPRDQARAHLLNRRPQPSSDRTGS
jgi:NADP-dependent 3-hydroxy acid dehydrogenase YdfG